VGKGKKPADAPRKRESAAGFFAEGLTVGLGDLVSRQLGY